MEICVGMIGMQPTEFWNASITEVYAAIEGFTEFNSSGKEQPMTRGELDELMELHPD